MLEEYVIGLQATHCRLIAQSVLARESIEPMT